MSSMLTSQGLVLATAMAVSAGTLLLFDLFRDKSFPPPTSPIPGNQVSNPHDDQKQALKSCLSSGSKKREKEEKNQKKKRVKFADDVKDTKGNGELYRRGRHRQRAEIQSNCCGNEVLGWRKMPANRAALYSGILRDRVQRMGCSY
ncbi:uncharacterized protein LOC105158387 [Sesamum indicum]|uniref:Uncharacterized protein LOC105158387 n=1 Tax=Sesamum indicum TaxID=4182 RepID=A0A6I9STL0_SESIN|nr:uncharacterized protein LOC105158387 [Sesamum indicum]